MTKPEVLSRTAQTTAEVLSRVAQNTAAMTKPEVLSRTAQTTAAVSKREVLSRIAQTTAAMTKLKVIWDDKNIAISSKIRLMRSLAMSMFLYACETWTITADIERRIQALEMRCFRKLICISYRDHITNEEVKARNWKRHRAV